MEHLISMISDYADDLAKLNLENKELKETVAKLERKLTLKDNVIENIKQRVDEGYQTYELNDY